MNSYGIEMTIEIVDLPIENGGSFHRFLYVIGKFQNMKPQIRIDSRRIRK
jgi:hypothetical protein